jgi:hypothetical protein
MDRHSRKKKATKPKKNSLPAEYQAVTWANVKRQADFMYIMLTKNGHNVPPLPFGEQPTAAANLKCDEFFRQLFLADRVCLDMPPEIAPWISARLLTAQTMINTYEGNGARPPTAKTIEDALFQWTVTDWNECMFLLWSAFAPGPDGKTPTFKLSNFGSGLDPERFSGN